MVKCWCSLPLALLICLADDADWIFSRSYDVLNYSYLLVFLIKSKTCSVIVIFLIALYHTTSISVYCMLCWKSPRNVTCLYFEFTSKSVAGKNKLNFFLGIYSEQQKRFMHRIFRAIISSFNHCIISRSCWTFIRDQSTVCEIILPVFKERVNRPSLLHINPDE